VDQSIKIAIITSLIIGIVSGGLSGFGVYLYQNKAQQDVIAALKNQNEILNNTQTEQQKQTQIMNNTLYRWIENLEKKSQISALVRLEGEQFFSGSFGGSFGGGKFTRDTQAILSPIELMKNHTASFEIILTNIGDDTAVIESLSVHYYSFHGTGGEFGSIKGDAINIVLKPNSDPYSLFYDLDVVGLPNEGEIVFTIFHNTGFVEPNAIKFKVIDE